MDSALTTISNIIKIEKKIQIIDDSSFDESSVILKLKYEDKNFLLMIKNAFDRHYVINIMNPVTFGDIKTDIDPYLLANECNLRAIGSKCIAVHDDPGSFIFSREELIDKDDVKNKKHIIERIMLALMIAMEGSSILASILDEKNEK